MASKPRTIDEYLAAVSDDQRAALEKLAQDDQVGCTKG